MYAILMTTTDLFLLIAVVILSIVVAVLLWRNLRNQRELRDKNDVIIREVRENAQLRDELCDAWRRVTGESNNSPRVLRANLTSKS